MEQRSSDAAIMQSPPPGDGSDRIARLLGSPVLGLEQVDVPAARDVEGMAAWAQQPPVRARQYHVAAANRAEKHASSVADGARKSLSAGVRMNVSVFP